MSVDLFMPLAIVLFLTMVTTLRFSVQGTLKTANPVLRAPTHPAWLSPLVATGGFTLGAFYYGKMSPWPPATFHMIADKYGKWGAVAATEAAITADMWLLWAAATAFRIASPPQDTRMVKYYYAVNFVIGGFLMMRFLHVIDMGSIGLLPR